MTVGSLFSGIGGFDLGFERAGYDIAWQVEIDPFCQQVLATHWPNAKRYGDITGINWAEVERVDVLCGGFPCQPVSLAGQQLAQADERWLWPEFYRAIRDLRPRFVVVENVPGLLVHAMGDVLRDVAELGFDAEWQVLPAAQFGAPHLRRRVWLVAYPNGYQQGRRDESIGRSDRRDAEPAGHGTQGDVAHAEQRESGERSDADSERRRTREAEQVGMGGRDVAHANGGRCEQRNEAERRVSQLDALGDVPDGVRDGRRQGRPGRAAGLCDGHEGVSRHEDVADAHDPRREQQRRIFTIRPEQFAAECCGWWRTEPNVGRVAYGVPARVDRLRGLGNAVVPQIVEWIANQIKAVGEAEARDGF